jgi:protein gp37
VRGAQRPASRFDLIRLGLSMWPTFGQPHLAHSRHSGDLSEYPLSAKTYGDLLNPCVWVKSNGGMGSLYRSQHELIGVFKNGKARHRNNVELGRHGRNRTNVWTYPGVTGFGRQNEEGVLLSLHPTVKPVALVRLGAMGQPKYQGTTRVSSGRAKWNGIVKLDEAALVIPKRWRASKVIFVNSMSDLFHEAVPLEFIQAVFATMEPTPQHTFQVLTKRGDRLQELSHSLPWPRNVWMGVSVKSAEYVWRIERLRRSGAAVKFLSLEPLLGPLEALDLTGIDWAIAGGESGPGARPMNPAWVRSIRDQCNSAGVAFHFKQWGGVHKKKAGRILDGRTWDEFPRRSRSHSRNSYLFAD